MRRVRTDRSKINTQKDQGGGRSRRTEEEKRTNGKTKGENAKKRCIKVSSDDVKDDYLNQPKNQRPLLPLRCVKSGSGSED